MSAATQTPGAPARSVRRAAAAALCLATGAAVLTAAPAHATVVSGFTAGDLVVYRVGDGTTTLSSKGAAVSLDEFSPTGTLKQSVGLPKVVTGSNDPLVASGTAASEGLLTLSGDSRYLVATGYDSSVGTSGLSGSAASTTPRTVALVDGSDTINSTTALTDVADGNNPRSAYTTNGTNLWVTGAASGIRYTTVGSTTSTAITDVTNTATIMKNFRQLDVYNGQLYASADPTKNSSPNPIIAAIGTGTPMSGTNIPTNLNFQNPSPTQPYAYSFLTLGSGTAPDTLYVADNATGAIEKYSLSGGQWASDGSVSLPGITGITANDASGTVSIYATANGTGGAAGTVGTLYSLTDSSGLGGTLTGTPTLLATAPANESYRGVAFAPGTVIGSGGGVVTPPPAPTISTVASALPAAINDPTNATLEVDVADTAYPANQLTVTASSSNTTVAPQSGVSVTGTGATRTLSVTPGAVGYSTITLTVTAPDLTHASTTITYGVSADLGDPSDRYFSGAGNASAAIDVGGGYMLVGDDESDVIRLYNETQSGPPVKTFDFTGQLPFGSAEVDLESAACSGNTIYWLGSMSNNSSGNLAPARSTLFTTQITGSGASTSLTYGAAYTGLLSDLVNWDHNNVHGLGADHFGFYNSVNGGIGSHEDDALNVEGMEFAGSSSSTAYLAFRAPLEPTTDRHLALVVPVTNLNALPTGGGSVHATFGTPMLWDLGGLGIRDIRENADGTYLIIAGTADGTNSSFVLYSWDGNPVDAPRPTQTSLPLIPSGVNQGSWETIVSVPDPLSSGDTVQLLEDNGDTAWYGDSQTSKDTLPVPLQKDLGRVFTYTPPVPNTVTITADPQSITYGAADPTFTFQTSGLVGSDQLTTQPTCSVAGDHSNVGSYPISCSGAVTSDPTDNITYVDGTLDVTQDGTTTTASPDNNPVVTGQPVTYTATVAPATASTTPTGTVEFTADGTDVQGCAAVPVDASGSAACSVPGGLVAGSSDIVATYSGDLNYTASASTSFSETVGAADTSLTLDADNNPVVANQPVTFTADVAVTAPGTTGAAAPGGTVEFSIGGTDLTGCAAVPVDATGAATCSVPGGFSPSTPLVTATYSGDSNFNGSNATLSETVNKAATSVAVTASVNPPDPGESVAYTATVSPVAPGTGTPIGAVKFLITSPGHPSLTCAAGNAVTLSSGSGGCVIPAGKIVAGATYSVKATYNGSAIFLSSFGTLAQTIAQPPTTTTVTSSANPVVTGRTVTLRASVASDTAGAGTPTGTVTFTITGSDASVVTCTTADTVKLGSGSARCVIAAGQLTAAAAPYSIEADYSGSPSFMTSTGTLSQDVTKAVTTTRITQSAAKTVAGDPATFTATVKASPTSSTALGGSVVFTVTAKDGTAVECDGSGSGTVVGGVGEYIASCTVPANTLTVADSPLHVVAAYSGDGNNGSSSATATHSVTKPPATP